MGSADLAALEYQLWLVREDAYAAPQDAALGSLSTPGRCACSSTSLQRRAEAPACLVSSAAQRKAGPVVFMFCKMFQMARGDFMIKEASSVWRILTGLNVLHRRLSQGPDFIWQSIP